MANNSSKHGDKSDPQAEKSYACVSVQPGLQACKAAWLMIGERFLVSEAPELPIEGCDMETCECRFNQHDDRREPGERRTLNPDGGEAHKLRKNMGRRHDDN